MSKPISDMAGIRQTIRTLKKEGWYLEYVEDGGDEYVKVSNSELKAIEAIMAVGDSFLLVSKDGSGTFSQWVRFVLGNSPEEVICDYTMGLDDTLSPLFDKWDRD